MNQEKTKEQRVELILKENFKSKFWLALHFVERMKTKEEIIEFLHKVEDENIERIEELKKLK